MRRSFLSGYRIGRSTCKYSGVGNQACFGQFGTIRLKMPCSFWNFDSTLVRSSIGGKGNHSFRSNLTTVRSRARLSRPDMVIQKTGAVCWTVSRKDRDSASPTCRNSSDKSWGEASTQFVLFVVGKLVCSNVQFAWDMLHLYLDYRSGNTHLVEGRKAGTNLDILSLPGDGDKFRLRYYRWN